MNVEVRFLPSGERLRVPAGTTLLAAVRRAGLPIARSCGARGLCGRCAVRVLRGARGLSAEDELERCAKRRNRVGPRLRLACRAELRDTVEITAAYW